MQKSQIIEQFQTWLKNLNIKELLIKNYLLLCIVVVPLFILSFYYTFVASDKYISEAKVTLKQTGQYHTSFNLSIFGAVNITAREDAIYLKEYILSYDMLNYLDKRLDLKKIYQSKEIDFIQRLSAKATQEDFIKYYQRHIVDVSYDEISSILTLKVFAFKPQDAKNINEAILEQCERYINGVSHKIAKDQLNFIEQEVSSANQKMQNTKSKLIKFQDSYKVIDPTREAQTTASVVAQLESQLASQEAQLKNLLTYLSKDSFQVHALKNQIQSLKEQIENEKSKIVGMGGDSKLNKIAADYLNLKLEVDFSTDVYKATISALEAVRVDASRKLKNLVIIASPNLPDEALYPRKAYNLSLAGIILLTLYGILKIIIAVIKEHRI